MATAPASASQRIVIELEPEDVAHLQTVFRDVRTKSPGRPCCDVLACCRKLIGDAEEAGAPRFVVERLHRLEPLVEMVEDPDWQLPEADRARVLNALAYFANSNDLIPDHVPGLGFLDDALMVELITRELCPEIRAYGRFRAFREAESERRRKLGQERAVTREDWLHDERRQRGIMNGRRKWLPWRRKRESFLDTCP
jgi:uncharacterized membrane protein YkvA (DUF1232 family)